MARQRLTTTIQTFPVQVRNNVRFMLSACAELTDSTLYRMDAQRSNLLLAVEFGLQFPEAVNETGKLMAAVYPLIERRGYSQSWLPLMRRAASSVTDPLLALRLQSQVGHLLTMERQLDEAIAVLTSIAGEIETTQDMLLASRTHMRLGTAYFEKGDLASAERHARQALSIFHSTRPGPESPLHMGLLLNLLGQIHLERGRREEAIQFFKEAIPYFESSGDLTYLAGAYSNMGISKQELKAYDEAISCYLEALSLLEGTPSELQKCRVYLALGYIYDELSDIDRAEAAWQAANSPFMQKSGDSYLMGFVNCNLAVIKMKRGELAAALDLLEEADRLWIESEADLHRGHAFGLKGKIFERQGELEKALTACNHAERLLVKFPDHDWAQQRLVDTRRRQSGIRDLLKDHFPGN